MFCPFTLLRIDSPPPKPQKDLHAEILLLGLERTGRRELQALSDEDLYRLTDALATGFETKKEQVTQPGVLKRYQKQFDVLDGELKRRQGDRVRGTS